LFQVVCVYADCTVPDLVKTMGFHTYNLDRTVHIRISGFYNGYRI
jgi:hypothetical protein